MPSRRGCGRSARAAGSPSRRPVRKSGPAINRAALSPGSTSRPLSQWPSHSRSSGGIIVDLLVACEAVLPPVSGDGPGNHLNLGVTMAILFVTAEGPSTITPSLAVRLRPPTTARSPVATRVHRSSRSSSDRAIADKGASVNRAPAACTPSFSSAFLVADTGLTRSSSLRTRG